MYTYIITGKVHPERASVSFEEVHLSDSKGLWKIRIKCDASQITSVLDWDKDDPEGARATVEQFAQMVASSLGFSLNCGYAVEIVTVHQVGEFNNGYVFGVSAPLEKESNHIASFNDSLHFSVQNVFYRLALRDFMRAITDQMDCGFYCYRAIESVSKHFACEKKEGWVEMNKALGTTKEDITAKVKVFADPVRHGNWAEAKPLSTNQRREILEYTKDVLLIFRKEFLVDYKR